MVVHLYLHHHTLGVSPTARLVGELAENADLLPIFAVTILRFGHPFPHPVIENRISGQPEYKFHVIFPRAPIHEFLTAEMTITAHDEPGLVPMFAHQADHAALDTADIGRFVTAARAQHRQYHFTRDTLEDKKGHVAVLVVVVVEKRALLVSVGIEIAVVTVKDDAFGLFPVRSDEFLHETNSHVV